MTAFVLQLEPFDGRAILADRELRDCVELAKVDAETWPEARQAVDADVMFEHRIGWGYFGEPLACRYKPPEDTYAYREIFHGNCNCELSPPKVDRWYDGLR